MTESGGLPEVQFESTVCLFRGSPLTVTEVNILLISCCPQHWPSPMSWSALTLSEVTCDLLKQTLFDFLQSQSRIGRNQAERTNEIRRFAWQQRVAFSRYLDLHRCQLGLIVLSLALMFSDVWSALTLSEERCASLTCNWSICTSFLRLLVALFRQLNMSKETCFAISASYLWNVVPTHGRMPVTTRRIGTISALTCDFIPFVNRFSILFVRWFSLSVFGCLRIWCRRRRPLFLFEKFAPVTRSSNSMMETTRVSFRTLSSCLPLPAISHFPFNVGSIFLSTPCHYSSMNHIVSGFEVPTSHLLVKKQAHWCF